MLSPLTEFFESNPMNLIWIPFEGLLTGKFRVLHGAFLFSCPFTTYLGHLVISPPTQLITHADFAFM